MRPIQPLPKPFREGYTYCLSLIGFQRCNNDNSMVLATINVQRFTRRTATITIINNPDWYRRDSQLKDRLTNSKIKICTFSKRIEFLGNSINFERNFETKFVENVFFFGEDWEGGRGWIISRNSYAMRHNPSRSARTSPYSSKMGKPA